MVGEAGTTEEEGIIGEAVRRPEPAMAATSLKIRTKVRVVERNIVPCQKNKLIKCVIVIIDMVRKLGFVSNPLPVHGSPRWLRGHEVLTSLEKRIFIIKDCFQD